MSKERLLKKIKALAEQGSGGEQENAQEMLKRLMLKYNIDEKDLSDDVVEDYEVRYKTEYERKLIIQIIYAVQGDNYRAWTYRYGIKKIGYAATASEHIEIEAMIEFYTYHFKKDLEIFYTAFLAQNDIYPSPDKIDSSKDDYDELSEERKEQLRKASRMKSTLDKHIRLKTIDYTGE